MTLRSGGPWGVFLGVFLVFLWGPVRTGARDNIPAQLLTEALLSGKGFDLSSYYPSPVPVDYMEVRWNGKRLVSKFPVVHALAVLPAAVVVRTAFPGLGPIERSRLTGRVAGTLFTAGAVGVLFAVLRRVTSSAAALRLALGAAFASTLYSVASRELWNHGPAALLLVALIWFSLGPGSWRIAAAGACVAGLYFVRHATLLPGLVLFVLVHRNALLGSGRAAFLRAATLGALACAAPLALLNRAVSGGALGSYAPRQALEYTWGLPDPAVIVAYIVSPARGLLWFVPLTFLAAAGLRRAGERPELRDLALGCGGALGVALLEIACYGPWWGGLGFGPRFLTEYVPLIAILAAFARPPWLRWGTLLLLPAVALHAGYVFLGGHAWDERRQVDSNPAAVWDVRDSPVSDLLFGPPRPDVLRLDPAHLAMELGQHTVGEATTSPWLVYGWESLEPAGLWASGVETWLAFSPPEPGRYLLTLSVAAPQVGGETQELIIVPADPAAAVSHVFSGGLWNYEQIPIEVPYRSGVVVLRVRPRHIWMPGHGDVRRCSFYLRWLSLERKG